MIRKIDHIAIVVKNLDEEIKKYREILGLTFLGSETVKEQKVRIAVFEIGGIHIELMEPLSEDSPVSNFLQKREGGIHHLAFEVDDLDSQIQKFKEKKVSLIDSQPRDGANGSKIVFVHPKGFSGVLLEMLAKKK
jgi:methylmalonyl-CoA/ethylmalonyl-CoA epimerase